MRMSQTYTGSLVYVVSRERTYYIRSYVSNAYVFKRYRIVGANA